jgi:hypothetical protein
LILVAIVTLTAGGIFFLARSGSRSSGSGYAKLKPVAAQAEKTVAVESAKPIEAAAIEVRQSGEAAASERVPSVAPVAEPMAARERIQVLVTDFTPGRLAELAGYLDHRDVGVREAAKLALLVRGDASAAPWLRTAAVRASTAEEAAGLREAAEVLTKVPATEAAELAVRPAGTEPSVHRIKEKSPLEAGEGATRPSSSSLP